MRFMTVMLILCLYSFISCTMATSLNNPLLAVSGSIENFSVNFFKTVAHNSNYENLISSPASAHIILSMAAYGANDKTALQMQKILHLPNKKSDGQQGFQTLLEHLNVSNKDVTFNMASRIYIANKYQLKNKYKEMINNYFFSNVCELDVTTPQKSAQLINAWIEKQTSNKIHDIVADGDITANTYMFLLNAIYFKGNWKKSFLEKSTENKSFYISKKIKKQVPTMFNYDEYVNGNLPDLKAQFIVLPYRNSDLSMVIIIPNRIEGLNNLIRNYNSLNYTRLDKDGIFEKVYVYLPKFKFESTIHLKEPLKQLGLTEMFTEKANFSGISNNPLLVNSIIQKAFIDVNEEGTEAAASTVSMMVPYSYNSNPRTIIVNRPFLFQIIDTRNKLTLFIGAVTDPEKH
ncbi:PREDICTED: serpin B6-like isoform X2 [Ceratosolen solmsi marchali]|uniref:Serpin B6-like isoform X2 n=1 Tax=Ceratosolen solmsi marchali TaxID=326594 RepID=A0AAJ6YGN7_9HYME|nr:PREDICTED: serpin B6-like isoform X2 [Ceratosolen solmsi marchali]